VSLLFGFSVAGHPGITHYTSACTFSRFGTKPTPMPGMVNSAQTSKGHEITKVTAEAPQVCALRVPRRNMKTSTKDKIKGSFHEVKGAIKEEVGKVTNDRSLKAKGKAEKKSGKVQQRIGRAKEDVAKLKGKLTELKTG
jgi:uncharacterized protein YjbJ (UPF0337 family)